jgi:hypothetical protein
MTRKRMRFSLAILDRVTYTVKTGGNRWLRGVTVMVRSPWEVRWPGCPGVFVESARRDTGTPGGQAVPSVGA